MEQLIALDNIFVKKDDSYGKGGKELVAETDITISKDETFALPADRAAVLIELGVVKKAKSNQKGAKDAG